MRSSEGVSQIQQGKVAGGAISLGCFHQEKYLRTNVSGGRRAREGVVENLVERMEVGRRTFVESPRSELH